MPFIAVDDDGQPLLPVNVDDDETALCPQCDEEMKVREGERIARHFYHPPESTCAGESSIHLAMKSIALQKLTTEYDDSTVRVEFRAEDTPRRADVFVEFSEPQHPLGAGIAVEVQYRNDAKDITETTADYLTGGYSVIWLFEENYEGEHPDYDDVELPQAIPAWPFGVPHGPSLDETGTKADYLNITETDLAPYLSLDSAGQLSVTEFGTTQPDKSTSPTNPSWSLKQTIHLNLSPSSPGVKELYRSWVYGLIREKENARRESVESRKQEVESAGRSCYLSKRFWRGEGDTFEIGLDAHSHRPSRFWVKKYSGGFRPEIETYTKKPIGEQLTEFVIQACYELESAQKLAPQNGERTAVWTGSIDKVWVGIYRTHSDTVQACFGRDTNSIVVDLGPVHFDKLVELCAEIRLWYGKSA
ncbi:competence protein CoiA family protein [Halopelagius longus]|uniref:Competence protein CoiA n=1 Tax=Halopelagius longus TaxID=1236180 RepID=A0A1H0XNY0_9EURY|nr:competence protein CoiA family protein [Halopelagius longus]RDI71984.1 competence protein CoiA [Halopelagius longus]SDQ04638.1 Competence protein CoiA-like family protein [Halopelagius longus]